MCRLRSIGFNFNPINQMKFKILLIALILFYCGENPVNVQSDALPRSYTYMDRVHFNGQNETIRRFDWFDAPQSFATATRHTT